MDMPLADALRVAADMAALGLSMLAMWLAWWRTRRDDVEKRFKEMEVEMREMRASIATSAGREAVHELQLTLASLNGELKVLAQQMQGQTDVMTRLERIVSRHEEHLLDGAGR